ncbi:hypothetical protein [Lactococcus petauri]|uniref:hypothetical protein n=1 Tax=Lactococcus petauri TaxID=1940789 RepID=UPI00177DB360|nr:hypothetical protein [Lactococcus petauri]MBD5822923.1 hypothetical protein [Lactococcus petauri]
MKRMTLLIGFIAAVWITIYLGTVFEFPLISLQIISLLLLFTSFRLVKLDGNRAWPYILIIDIFLVFFLFTFYNSRYFFTYIQYDSDVTEILIIAGSFIISQILGIFWGSQFYINPNKK